ncbi:four-carbon acid sugar kinase family protein [Neorhizobium sp. P12A]|uniref:four-carbon acid sugar kinase family protein n=1 Tax=Neorhizobium sp. P12A TaxID=2268027 RepID=UPI0011EFFF82|nr:four-carbon acid sugar kinase family protein [Neorhizobium sp. P12A]KAA0697785.1 four-carbon acid sugar kinase family protein [Neorhizobium sp. P12A]
MPLKIAIVADDLTGAIDTATPFAKLGMKVTVALSGDHLKRALAEDPDVLTVATGTRHMNAAAAGARLFDITLELRRFSPEFYFKKIDSRLKGNVVSETVAMLEGLARGRVVLAPAIPEQGRLLQNGHVTGRGVDQPIPLPAFPDDVDVYAPDVIEDSDLGLVADHILENPAVLAVGARGLGQALADRLSIGSGSQAALDFTFPLLIVIGSRDPITIRQVEHLIASEERVAVIIAPNGNVPADLDQVPDITLVRCVETETAESSEIVAERLGTGIAAMMLRNMPGTLIASGGDTAAAILGAAGVETIHPIGEIETGLPLSAFTLNDATAHLITKSGGFGHDQSLSDVIEEASLPPSA